MIKNKLALSLVVFLMASLAFGGTGKSIGTYGALELTIPTGAKGIALSESNLATVHGVDAMFYNPAGIANMTTSIETQLSDLNYLADIGVTYAAFVTKMGNNTVGLSAKIMDFGDILHTTTDDPNGYSESYFSPKYSTVSASFAKIFSDRISFGATAKVVNESFIQTSATGLAFDMGVQYKAANTPIAVGVSLRNIGDKMLFSGADMEQKLEPSGSEEGTIVENFAVVAQAFELPTSLDIGVTYTLLKSLSLHGVFKNNSYGFNEYRLGGEFAMNTSAFKAWVGGGTSMYIIDDDTDDWENADALTENSFGVSFGGGLAIPLGSLNLGVEYGFRTTSINGLDDLNVLAFTFGF